MTNFLDDTLVLKSDGSFKTAFLQIKPKMVQIIDFLLKDMDERLIMNEFFENFDALRIRNI